MPFCSLISGLRFEASEGELTACPFKAFFDEAEPFPSLMQHWSSFHQQRRSNIRMRPSHSAESKLIYSGPALF